MTFDEFLHMPRNGDFLEKLKTLPKPPRSDEEVAAKYTLDLEWERVSAVGLSHLIDNPNNVVFASVAKQKIWKRYEQAMNKWLAITKKERTTKQRWLYDHAIKAGIIDGP